MPNEYLRPSEMKEQQQTIANISGSCHTLLTHLGVSLPAMPPSIRSRRGLSCSVSCSAHITLPWEQFNRWWHSTDLLALAMF